MNRTRKFIELLRVWSSLDLTLSELVDVETYYFEYPEQIDIDYDGLTYSLGE